jgi:hypothetical protein
MVPVVGVTEFATVTIEQEHRSLMVGKYRQGIFSEYVST